MSATLTITAKNRVPVALCVLVLAVVLQSLHFYFYYQQPAANSIIWSVVDWAAWFAVIALCHGAFARASRPLRANLYWPVFGLVVVLAGPLQIVLSSAVYGLFTAPSQPFVEDVLHLYDKRWLQNLIYAGLLWQLFNMLWPLRQKALNGDAIKVTDGKTVHWLKPRDIHFVAADRNYLALHLGAREILIREPMKDFMARLPEGAFIRISRSHLVNAAMISKLEPYSKHSKQVVLSDGTSLQIGRTYLTGVKAALS